MNKNNGDEILKAEREMIRKLRKRIYGDSDAGPKYPFSDNNRKILIKKFIKGLTE